MLTVVVPYRDNKAGLIRLLDSLPDVWVMVVDDCSDEPLELTKRKVRVHRLSERGYFSGAVNAGMKLAVENAKQPTDFLILNQDVWFENTDWIKSLMGYPPRVATIGDGVMGHPAWPKGYVQGTCMWIAYDAYLEVGGLDAKNWPLWGATAEWQLRACRLGWECRPIEVPGLMHERGTKQYGSSIQKLLDQEPHNRGLYIRTPPLISAVTTSYNYGRYIHDWMASFVGGESSIGKLPKQSFDGFEIVMVDDASTDDTWEIMKSYVNPWKGIRAVQRKTHGGTSAALNTAIRQAYGRYIVVCDCDDMLAPNALEVFLEHIEKDLSKMYYTDQRILDNNGLGKRQNTREYDFEQLLNRNMVPSGCIFTKQAWRDSGGYPERFANGRQDWAFAVAMGSKNHCGERISEPLYYYRRQGQNRSLTNTTPSYHREFRRMMEQTFPAPYGGNMAGCCGGRSSVITKTLAEVPIVPGEKGMVLLTYVGGNVGRLTIKGGVTGIRYTVKGTRPSFYADSRDVPSLTSYVEDKKYVIIPTQEPTGDPMAIQEELQRA